MDTAAYCREIETYLCRKNDGHLIRVVGPSFEIVSRWAEQGVPLKIACAGIDRYFERYYRKGPRRRPVKIDFCEADVLDAFDEWRRAVGLPASSASAAGESAGPDPDSAFRDPDSAFRDPDSAFRDPDSAFRDPDSAFRVPDSALRIPDSAFRIPHSALTPHSALRTPHSSLPAHLERVLLRLSSARARGTLGDAFDGLIDRVSAELDAARGRAGGLRGAARQALIDRLAVIDSEVLRIARESLDADAAAALGREADADLAAFRSTMAVEAYARARGAALDRLVRERFALPAIRFE